MLNTEESDFYVFLEVVSSNIVDWEKSHTLIHNPPLLFSLVLCLLVP